MRTIRIAMAQINPTVGALSANAKLILAFARKAKSLGAALVIFPELAVTGYPPEDLLLKPRFISDNISTLKEIAKKISGITAVVGFVDRKTFIYNAAAVIHNGRVAAVYHKMYLPNYGVFDEQRYFQAGREPLNFVLDGVTIGLNICEDIWYPDGPAKAQSLAGAELIVNINASPYNTGKALVREEMLVTRAVDNGCVIAYNNTVGGQDELVFDGRGLIIDAAGAVVARARAFEQDLVVHDIDLGTATGARERDTRRREALAGPTPAGVRAITLKGATPKKRPRLPKRTLDPLDFTDEILKALVLGTSDYVKKNGFSHAVIGLSGGIDSALVAAVAVLALGADKITGVFMPSRYSSKASREDAEALAKNLGIKLMTVPIESTFKDYLKVMKKPFAGKKTDVTEENLQARIRGNILMALSNKFGWLVLTTGNKSEMSVGYATLYGDMAGGFAVIKDLPKTLVYRISRKVNETAARVLIPERVFVKAPSAELRPGQKDQDSLPPYEILDPILKAYVEDDLGLEDIVAMGFKRPLVKKVIRLVDKSEYKRRQAPPGVKITPRALGKDRRMPITNGYEDEKTK